LERTLLFLMSPFLLLLLYKAYIEHIGHFHMNNSLLNWFIIVMDIIIIIWGSSIFNFIVKVHENYNLLE